MDWSDGNRLTPFWSLSVFLF